MRISDWSSDVCSSDLEPGNTITYSITAPMTLVEDMTFEQAYAFMDQWVIEALGGLGIKAWYQPLNDITSSAGKIAGAAQTRRRGAVLHHVTMAYDIDAVRMLEVLRIRSEAHTSELQSLMRISYAVFCLQ